MRTRNFYAGIIFALLIFFTPTEAKAKEPEINGLWKIQIEDLNIPGLGKSEISIVEEMAGISLDDYLEFGIYIQFPKFFMASKFSRESKQWNYCGDKPETISQDDEKFTVLGGEYEFRVKDGQLILDDGEGKTITARPVKESPKKITAAELEKKYNELMDALVEEIGEENFLF